MARVAQEKIYADFRQGFVTEANPLAYPEGSVKDLVNFDVKLNGTIAKRPGLQPDTPFSYNTDLNIPSANQTNSVQIFYWKSVNQDPDLNYLVVFTGLSALCFRASDKGIDFTAPEKTLTTSLYHNPDVGTWVWDHPGIARLGDAQRVDAVSSDGSLVVARSNGLPFRMYLDEEDNLTTEDIEIKIRDLDVWRGISDEDTGTVRHNKLTAIHEYNLRNGGWPTSARTKNESGQDSNTTVRNPIDYTNSRLGFYPNLAMAFHIGRSGLGDSTIKQEAFSPWNFENDYIGSGLVPKGRFIVNASSFERQGRGRDELTGMSNTLSYTKSYWWSRFPTTVAWYAGRCWYAGARGYREHTEPNTARTYKTDNLEASDTIYFSQQLNKDSSKIGLCYQENDPTAEDMNELLATDGGTVSIKGLGEVYTMEVFGTNLLVFSSEGVWAISGTEGSSFSATSYSVSKISSKALISPTTVVAENDTVFFLAEDAIFFMGQDEVTGTPQVQDISSERIQSFYKDLPMSVKKEAILGWDEKDKCLFIIYSDLPKREDSPATKYNKSLIFNVNLGCYYKYEFPEYLNSEDTRRLVKALYFPRDQEISLETLIVLDGEPVMLDDENVVFKESRSVAAAPGLTMLFIDFEEDGRYISSASFIDQTEFKDFDTSYYAECVMGFDTMGDVVRDSLKAPRLVAHMERTEEDFMQESLDGRELDLVNPSSCQMSTAWDWSTNYSRPVELYRFNRAYTATDSLNPFAYGKDVISTKHPVRGRGQALGLSLYSPPAYNCKLLGIGVVYTISQGYR